ncbi:hypothetical protein [Prauserella marina]|nr:hypothetical protein [Prauserella marina]
MSVHNRSVTVAAAMRRWRMAFAGPTPVRHWHLGRMRRIVVGPRNR